MSSLLPIIRSLTDRDQSPSSLTPEMETPRAPREPAKSHKSTSRFSLERNISPTKTNQLNMMSVSSLISNQDMQKALSPPELGKHRLQDREVSMKAQSHFVARSPRGIVPEPRTLQSLDSEDLTFTPASVSPRAPRKAISDISSAHVSFPLEGLRLSSTEDLSQANTISATRLRRDRSTRVCINRNAITLSACHEFPRGRTAERNTFNMVDFSRKSTKSVLSSSDNSSPSESPDVSSLRSTSTSHSQVKTLSSIGHNHVTFSPSRSTIREEIGGIRRTGDANLEKTISWEDYDFAGAELNGSIGRSLGDFHEHGQENHFKTVNLLKESVTQWFTGKSRERSMKVLPALIEEEETTNEEPEQQEDVLQAD